jgi:hypothetical protein
MPKMRLDIHIPRLDAVATTSWHHVIPLILAVTIPLCLLAVASAVTPSHAQWNQKKESGRTYRPTGPELNDRENSTKESQGSRRGTVDSDNSGGAQLRNNPEHPNEIPRGADRPPR